MFPNWLRLCWVIWKNRRKFDLLEAGPGDRVIIDIDIE